MSTASSIEAVFITDKFRYQNGALPFTVLEDLLYYSQVLDTIITVPAGFQTDFASAPRLFWRIWPPIGTYTEAAVVHDWLYFSGLTTRAQADRVFKEAMKVLEVNGFTLRMLYLGVRVGGWVPWNKYRARQT